jgi:hypothetical protein
MESATFVTSNKKEPAIKLTVSLFYMISKSQQYKEIWRQQCPNRPLSYGNEWWFVSYQNAQYIDKHKYGHGSSLMMASLYGRNFIFESIMHLYS